MAARGRKRSPSLTAESLALTRALQDTTAVLLRWHPGSMPLAIITQQLAAVMGELRAADEQPEQAG